MKKNKQPTHARRPGRLRSWSGPVESDFQGRLRFSYANMPGHTASGCSGTRCRRGRWCTLSCISKSARSCASTIGIDTSQQEAVCVSNLYFNIHSRSHENTQTENTQAQKIGIKDPMSSAVCGNVCTHNTRTRVRTRIPTLQTCASPTQTPQVAPQHLG